MQEKRRKNSSQEELNDIDHTALQSALYPSVREPPELARNDGKRPDGMTQVPFGNGKPWVWDCTCPDTKAVTYIGGTSKEAGSAANKSERKKSNKYCFLNSEYFFSGLAFETLGACGQEADVFSFG